MRAHVFPGVGRQKTGMAAELFRAFPEVDRRAEAVLGWSVERLCRDDPDRRLRTARYAQPVTFVVNALHALAAARAGAPPADFLAGHSLGEYNALLAADVFDLETGLGLVARRAELMSATEPGAMVAVIGTSEEDVAELLAGPRGAGVTIANHNAPDQVVLAGRVADVARVRAVVEARLGEDSVIPLVVGPIASHSPLMSGVAEALRESLAAARFSPPRVPVISNVTARPHDPAPDAVRDALARQVAHPVRWSDTVRHLRRAGVTEFVELGESDTLTKLIARIPAEPAGWREYRDERVLALLAAHLEGTLGLDDLLDTLERGR